MRQESVLMHNGSVECFHSVYSTTLSIFNSYSCTPLLFCHGCGQNRLEEKAKRFLLQVMVQVRWGNLNFDVHERNIWWRHGERQHVKLAVKAVCRQDRPWLEMTSSENQVYSKEAVHGAVPRGVI